MRKAHEIPVRSSPAVAKAGLLLLAMSLSAALPAGTAPAAPLLTEGFESYQPGPLDKNLAGGPNAAANGSGNPWFGPSPPNATVVGAENGVVPHGGSQMLRGAMVDWADYDQDWFNLAYRLNGGAAFTGGVALDWWFYDALGAGGLDFKDSLALGYYSTAPAGTDYAGAGNLSSGAPKIQWLALGASNSQQSGFDAGLYQARLTGAGDGYFADWFNTGTPRSVGWHHAWIEAGPAMADGTNDVNFYIDDFSKPTLSHGVVGGRGYNVIEIRSQWGPQTGYFDDITFGPAGVLPEPGAAIVICLGGLALLRRRA